MKVEGPVRVNPTCWPFTLPTRTELPTSFKAGSAPTFTESRPPLSFFTALADASGIPATLRAAIPQTPASTSRRETDDISTPDLLLLALAVKGQISTAECSTIR